MAGRSKKAGQRLLMLKHNIWWFRRAIPEVCQSILGRGKFLMENLQTSDLKRAQSLRDELETETSKLFDLVRTGEYVPPSALNAREQGLLHRAAILAAAEDSYADKDEISALEVAITSAESTAEAFRSPYEKQAFQKAVEGKEAIGAHLEAHLATLRRNGIVERSASERGGLIKRFIKWCDARKPSPTLDNIDRRIAGQYVAEVLDEMNAKTQSKHLMALRGYWIHLRARGVIEAPAETLRNSGWPWNDQQIRNRATRAERGSRDDKERPFTTTELQALLYSPYPETMSKAHVDQLHDVMRIALLSGMRMAEVLTLWVDDVKKCSETGGLIFDIQEGKSDASARPVPVHPDLLPIVHRLMKDKTDTKKSTGAWLFDEMSTLANPRDTFGKRFARYRAALGVDERREGKRRSLTNFHSTRRWFATQAARAGQPEAVIKDVIGHKPDEKNVTRRYIAQSSAVQMRECVEAISLPQRP